MKQDKTQRRVQASSPRRRSSAAAILSGKGEASTSSDFFSYGWLLLIATFITVVLISFLGTGYTNQLDEIKNVLLMLMPPVLLLAALWRMDFSAITWKRHGALILLGLYFAWMCLSWLLNPYKMVGERVIWFNLGVATFTVVLAWYLNTEEKVRKTMIFFVMLGLLSTLLGLFLYAGRYTRGFYEAMMVDPAWQTPGRLPWRNFIYTLTSSSSDMYSFILNTDFYAAFLVMLIPLSLSMFFVEQRTFYKILALASILLMNLCLFLTNSNDSFLAMFLMAYPLYFLLGWKYVREWGLSRRVVLTFTICTVISLVLIGIFMLPKLSATYNFKTAAFEGRQVLWGGGFWPWIYGDNINGEKIDIISIIFGTGPGGYRHYFPWFRRPDFFDQQINNVTTFSHNFYLDVLLETGLVGLLLFVGFHVRVVADGLRQIRTTESRTHLFYQLAVLSGLAGIAVQNFSSPNNRWAVAGMIYWSMFGLSMGLKNVEELPVTGENIDRRIGGIPVYKISRWACLGLAGLFALRCIAPGTQFYDYWRGATEHAIGMRDMEMANYRGLKPEQEYQQMAQAMAHLESAIEYNPTFATSYYKLGHVYNRIGQMTDNPIYSEKAIHCYEELNRINPNYSEVHLNLGIMYAQKAGTAVQYRTKLAENLEKLKEKLKSSLGSNRKAIEDDIADMTQALKEMDGPVNEITQKYMVKAFEHMKQAAHQSLKPNTQYFAGSTGREVANLYEANGEPEKAKQVKEEIKRYFRSILEYKPKLAEVQADQKEYYQKAQRSLLTLMQETKDNDGTIEVLKGMVRDNPDNDLMLQALLEAYDMGKKQTEKLQYLEAAVHSDPTDATLRKDLAHAYKQANQPGKYLAELRRVEVLTPDDPAILQELKAAYEAAGDAGKVSAVAEKMVKLGLPARDTKTSAPPVTITTGTAADTLTSGPKPEPVASTTATAVETTRTEPAPLTTEDAKPTTK